MFVKDVKYKNHSKGVKNFCFFYFVREYKLIV